jgi:tetratricopeptide (TPR) repeat protein
MTCLLKLAEVGATDLDLSLRIVTGIFLQRSYSRHLARSRRREIELSIWSSLSPCRVDRKRLLSWLPQLPVSLLQKCCDLILISAVKLFQEGKYKKAIPIAQSVLALDRHMFGPDGKNTLVGMSNLSLLYRSVSDYSKGVPLYQEILQIDEKLYGSENADIAAAMNNQAPEWLQLFECPPTCPSCAAAGDDVGLFTKSLLQEWGNIWAGR